MTLASSLIELVVLDARANNEFCTTVSSLPSSSCVIVPPATPAKRKLRKILVTPNWSRWSYRKIWKVVCSAFLEGHPRSREKGCMCVSASVRFPARVVYPSSERKRKAKEIIQSRGVDTAEYFTAVVKPNPTGVTLPRAI